MGFACNAFSIHVRPANGKKYQTLVFWTLKSSLTITSMYTVSRDTQQTMNDLTFNLFFATGCILSYVPALWLRFSYAGKNCTHATSAGALLYSVFFTYLHWRFIDKGALPFLGVYEREPMGWLSLFMVLAHTYALPTEGNIWFWNKKKNL